MAHLTHVANSSTTRTSEPATISAAGRVFDVPELLEQILLLAAKPVPRDPRTRPPFKPRSSSSICPPTTLLFPPMPGHQSCRSSEMVVTGHCGRAQRRTPGISLFRLQSVSRSFRNTILGSKKLKRLIYLAPIDEEPATTGGLSDELQPLRSLVNRIAGNQEDENGYIVWNDLTQDNPSAHQKCQRRIQLILKENSSIRSLNTYRNSKKMVESLFHSWARPEASWRRIKISTAEKPRPLDFVVTASDNWKHVRPYIGEPSVTWHLDASTTLGDVYERLLRLFRTFDDARAAKMDVDMAFSKGAEEIIRHRNGHAEAKAQHGGKRREIDGFSELGGLIWQDSNTRPGASVGKISSVAANGYFVNKEEQALRRALAQAQKDKGSS